SRQLVNRVLLLRPRAVAAFVRDLEGEIDVHLLARLHAVRNLARALRLTAAGFVQTELRIDQLPLVLEQPVDAVVIAALFIRGESEDDVTLGDDSLLLEAQQ